MRIAYTMTPKPGDTDLLLAGVAERLLADDLRVCGAVQINTRCEGEGPCDMHVKVLPDGPVLKISQTLGAGARGCRLDPDALETAVGLVGARLATGADLLLVNKFGKHEADGRGFRDVIAEALARDIPVIVGLNALNADAFVEFTGGTAVELAPEAEALANWIEEIGRDGRSAA